MIKKSNEDFASQMINFYVNVARHDKTKTARYFMEAEIGKKKTQSRGKHVYKVIKRHENEKY